MDQKEDAIQSAIDANHLGNRVRLLGRLGDAQLTNLYQSAGPVFSCPIFRSPGDMEGFGIVHARSRYEWFCQ